MSPEPMADARQSPTRRRVPARQLVLLTAALLLMLGRAVLGEPAQEIDGRAVYVPGTSVMAVAGPELPPGPTGFGGNVVPVVDVFADTEDVAKDVMRQLLPLFPPA